MVLKRSLVLAVFSVLAVVCGGVGGGRAASIATPVATPAAGAEVLYVSSGDTDSVLAYDGETGAFLRTFASGGGLTEPEGIAFGPDGNLYVSSRSDAVLRYDGKTGAFIDVFASGHGLVDPAGIAFGGPENDLFVSSGLTDGGRGNQQEILGQSPVMRALNEQIGKVVDTRVTVLIEGETGTGKELVASAIHYRSRRRDKMFIGQNCAAMPEQLLESELFGHKKGAFTGAHEEKKGLFEIADGGTLFLDEVGEIPLDLQGKLLRVLQEQSFEPVGDDRTRTVNVRVVAATNRPLEAEVEAGRFRRDLYYRLSVLPLPVPPLRERRADILPMARRFLATTALRLNVSEPELSAEDEAALLTYDFPGNVRELENLMERAVVLGLGGPWRSALDHLRPGTSAGHTTAEEPRETKAKPQDEGAEVIPVSALLDLERKNIENALLRCDFKIAGERGAAKLLRMSPSTLNYRMQKLGIERRRP